MGICFSLPLVRVIAFTSREIGNGGNKVEDCGPQGCIISTMSSVGDLWWYTDSPNEYFDRSSSLLIGLGPGTDGFGRVC